MLPTHFEQAPEHVPTKSQTLSLLTFETRFLILKEKNDALFQKSLFGKGIYLSSELSVSLPYSPVGYGWGGSILGSDMSCVALCEIINHPDVKIGDTGSLVQKI